MSDNDTKINLATFELERPYQKFIDYSTGLMTFNETVILDNNSSNKYPYGNITWSSQSIGQLGADRLFCPSQGYVQIPIKTTLKATAATFLNDGAVVPSNCCAIAHKSKLAWFNRVTERIGGTDVGLMTENRQYYQIMRSHEVNDEVTKQHYEDQLDHYAVNPVVRRWHQATVGEVDNQSVLNPSDLSVMQTLDVKNDIFYKQGRKFQYYGATNIDFHGTDTNVNPLSAIGSGTQNAALQLQKHYELANDTITFYDVLEVPLKHLSAIGQLPPCSTLNGLLLKVEIPHCASGVKMDIEYVGTALNGTKTDEIEYLPVKFTYSGATSQMYPYIHGQVANVRTKGYPCVALQGTAGTNFTITSTSEIGWGDKIQGAVARLVIPSFQIGEMMSKIVAQPKVKIDILDAIVDTNLFQRVNNGQVYTNALLSAPIAKPCRIWMLPFLHASINGVASATSPQMSPFSMAPCRTSPLNLLNLQLHISTQAVYPQPLNTKRDYYNLYSKVVNPLVGGNSFHSAFRNAPQLSFEQFCLSPIYCFDVSQKYLDEATHSENKMIGFSFQADFGKRNVGGANTADNVGQIVVVVESYQSFMFDRITSLVGF